jgi:hypothetical protein
MGRRTRSAVVGASSGALIASVLLLAPAGAAATADETVSGPADAGLTAVEPQEIVPITAASREALSELGDRGYDLGEEVEDAPDGVRAHAVLTKTQQEELRALGVGVGRAVKRRRTPRRCRRSTGR